MGGSARRNMAAAAPPHHFIGASVAVLGGMRDNFGGLGFLSMTGVLFGSYLRRGVIRFCFFIIHLFWLVKADLDSPVLGAVWGSRFFAYVLGPDKGKGV